MKTLLTWLFKKYRTQFEELFVKELIGEIPKEISENALAFLVNGREKLEPWFRWQSYIIQRKSVATPIRTDIYHGILVHIKTMMMLLDAQKAPKKVEEQLEDIATIPDPMEGVQKFAKMHGGKKNT